MSVSTSSLLSLSCSCCTVAVILFRDLREDPGELTLEVLPLPVGVTLSPSSMLIVLILSDRLASCLSFSFLSDTFELRASLSRTTRFLASTISSLQVTSSLGVCCVTLSSSWSLAFSFFSFRSSLSFLLSLRLKRPFLPFSSALLYEHTHTTQGKLSQSSPENWTRLRLDSGKNRDGNRPQFSCFSNSPAGTCCSCRLPTSFCSLAS